MNPEHVSLGGEATYKYWAFISYSHADDKWAQWLHKQLETFPVPRPLVGRETERGYAVPKRLFPLFRDREELPGAANLAESISAALRDSRYLIVMCSPRSAVSRWVNQEVMAFKAMGRADRVLCLIVDGEPNATDKPDSGLLECFPPGVRFGVGADGNLTAEREEPIAADGRAGKDGRRDALIKVASGLLGVSFDELKRRDMARRRRQRMALGVLGLLVALAVGWAAQQFREQRLRIQAEAASMVDFREADAAFATGDSGLGLAHLARAVRLHPGNKVASQRLFYELTYRNWSFSQKVLAGGDGLVLASSFSPDGTHAAIVIGKPSELILVRLIDGTVTQRILAKEGWYPDKVDFIGSKRLAVRVSSSEKDEVARAVTVHNLDGLTEVGKLEREGLVANFVMGLKDGEGVAVGWGLPTDEERKGQNVILGGVDLWNPLSPPRFHRASSSVKVGAMHPSTGEIWLGGGDDSEGFIATVSGTAPGPITNVLKVDAPVTQIGLSVSDDPRIDHWIVAGCADNVIRIFVSRKGAAPELHRTIADRAGPLFAEAGGHLVMVNQIGQGRLYSLGGDELAVPWAHGSEGGGVAVAEVASIVATYSGVNPIYRGGALRLRDVTDPLNKAAPPPMDPPVSWPLYSIANVRLDERGGLLHLLRHWPTKGGAQWDLVEIPIKQTTARPEEVLSASSSERIDSSLKVDSHGRLVLYRDDVFRQGEDKDHVPMLVVFDCEQRRELLRFRVGNETRPLAISVDGGILAEARDQLVSYSKSGEQQAALPILTPVVGIEFGEGAAEKLVAVLESRGTTNRVLLVDRSRGASLRASIDLSAVGKPSRVCLSPDGETVVIQTDDSAGRRHRTEVYRWRDGQRLHQFDKSHRAGSFSRDGRRFLAVRWHAGYLYDTMDWSLVRMIEGHSRMISCWAMDPLNRFLATGSLDGSVRFWALDDGREIGVPIPERKTVLEHVGRTINDIQINPSGDSILVNFGHQHEKRLGTFGVWNIAERLPVVRETSVMFPDRGWFVGDGATIAYVTGTPGRFLSLYDASFSGERIPPVVTDLAEALSRHRVGKELVKQNEVLDLEPQRQAAASATTPELSERVGRWLQWFTSNPLERTVSPFGMQSTVEYRRHLVMNLGMQRHLIDAFKLDPRDNLNLANLALVTFNLQEASKFLNSAMRADPTNKDLLFRKCVFLYQSSYQYPSGDDKAQTMWRELRQLLAAHFEADLDWKPAEQGLVMNLVIPLNHRGLLNLVALCGSPRVAEAALARNRDVLAALDKLTAEKAFSLLDDNRVLRRQTADFVLMSAYRRPRLGNRQDWRLVDDCIKNQPSMMLEAAVGGCLGWLDGESFEEKWSFMRFVMARYDDVFPAPNPNTDSLLMLFAIRLLEWEKWQEAEGVIRRSLDYRRQKIPEHWRRYYAESALGVALLRQGRIAEAGELIKAGYQGMKASSEPVPAVRMAEVIERMMLLPEVLKDEGRVMELRQDAAQLRLRQ